MTDLLIYFLAASAVAGGLLGLKQGSFGIIPIAAVCLLDKGFPTSTQEFLAPWLVGLLVGYTFGLLIRQYFLLGYEMWQQRTN